MLNLQKLEIKNIHYGRRVRISARVRFTRNYYRIVKIDMISEAAQWQHEGKYVAGNLEYKDGEYWFKAIYGQDQSFIDQFVPERPCCPVSRSVRSITSLAA